MASRTGTGDSYRPRQRSRSRSRSPRGFTGNSNSRYRDQEFQFEHQRHLPSRPPRESDRYGGRDRGRDRDRNSYRPSGPRAARGGRDRGERGGAPFKKRPFVPPPAYDRPILSFDYREKTPELLPGMVTSKWEKEETQEKNEAEEGEPMEMNDQEGERETVSTAKPTATTDPVAATTAENTEGTTSTVEPTPVAVVNGAEKLEVTEGKEIVEADKQRVDVITMIRQAKAKAAADKTIQKDRVAANDDFISLDFGDEKSSLESDHEDHRKMRRLNDSTKKPLELPPDRPFSHKEQIHGVYVPKNPIDEGPPGMGPLSRAGKLPPPPGPDNRTRNDLRKRRRGRDSDSRSNDEDDYDPESLNVATGQAQDFHPDIPKNRKRKYDEISRNSQKVDGNIKWELRPKPGINHIPWTQTAKDHSRTLKMTMWYGYLIFRPNNAVAHRCFVTGFTWKSSTLSNTSSQGHTSMQFANMLSSVFAIR